MPQGSRVVSYIYPPSWGNRQNRHSGPSCGYILSNATKCYNIYASNPTPAPLNKYVGVSSEPIDMSVTFNKNNSIASNINYTSDRTIYPTASNTYANYTKGLTYKMLDYENAPEFFAVLPLIKI